MVRRKKVRQISESEVGMLDITIEIEEERSHPKRRMKRLIKQ